MPNEEPVKTSARIDRTPEFKADSVFTEEEKAKLAFALEFHKETLILLSRH